MKPINVENLMGHSIGISDSYYRPTENDLLQDYLKCTDALRHRVNDERSLQSRVNDLVEKTKDKEYLDEKLPTVIKMRAPIAKDA